ncbi:MAG TPA: hypothetical protein VI756_15635 [Blastocatellia bacterium]
MTITADFQEEGWRQIEAGLALVTWSNLAVWNARGLCLLATSEGKFESPAGHNLVHKQFGRLICWISFGVGAEYLAKGVLLLHGFLQPRGKKVLRPPWPEEDIATWVALVNKDDASVMDEDLDFGTLGTLPLGRVGGTIAERELVKASYKLLANTIRNRDAHRYARNVRAFHFQAVERLFVPSFNILLRSLDDGELRTRVSAPMLDPPAPPD